MEIIGLGILIGLMIGALGNIFVHFFGTRFPHRGVLKCPQGYYFMAFTTALGAVGGLVVSLLS